MQIEPLPFADPVAQALIERVQQEYVLRYGGLDETPVDPAEFTPPHGLFLVAYGDNDLAAYDDGGLVLGCGGWRAHGDGAAEIKRMYVVPEARGRGVARALLAELERTAAAAGRSWVELFTGSRQPEAVKLYVSSGYRPVPGYGPYKDEPGANYFGKRVHASRSSRTTHISAPRGR